MKYIFLVLALFLYKFDYAHYRNKDLLPDTSSSVNPINYGAAGNGITDDSKSIMDAANYAASNGLKLILPLKYNIISDISFPDNSKIQIDGTLVGKGQLVFNKNCAIFGNGNIKTRPKTSSILLKGGNNKISGLHFYDNYYSTTEILIQPTIDSSSHISITNCYFERVNYGILKQGGTNTFKLSNVLIDNNTFKNLQGDAIEWNLATQDRNITVSNNRIDSIDGNKPNWGIGIGFAGGEYNSYENRVEEIYITNNIISNVRQGIHFEACNKFYVKGNMLANISTSFSNGTGVTPMGIIAYGCKAFVIDSNVLSNFTGAGAISCQTGVFKSMNTGQCLDYTISNNKLDNAGLISSLSGGETDIKITSNQCKNGSGIRVMGASRLVITKNRIVTKQGDPGLVVDYVSNSGFVNGFNARLNRSITLTDNEVADSTGRSNVKITNITNDSHLTKKGNTF